MKYLNKSIILALIACLLFSLSGKVYPGPLHDALYRDKIEKAKQLINDGADVNEIDKNGRSPLQIVSLKGNVEIVELLISKKANVNIMNHYGTPLHRATGYNRLKVIKILIKNGAKVNVKNNDGYSPLDEAVMSGATESADYLIINGAQIGFFSAAGLGKYDIVKKKIQSGIDVNIRHKSNKQTPLFWAVDHNRIEVVNLLLKHGALVTISDKYKRTPLCYASKYGHTNMANLLLKHGAFVNTSDKDKRTPLYYASKYGRTNMVKLLLKSGANINARDKYNDLPLHIAIKKKKIETIKVLIEHGNLLNARDRLGLTPLHLIARNDMWGRLEKCAILLLEKGADPNSKDSDGMTPLHYTALYNKEAIAKVLHKYGANLRAKDNAGGEPLDYAIKLKNNPVIYFLKSVLNKK